jgi:hypothetical protein
MTPTKNRVPNVTPLRFGWYFNDNDSGFITSGILKFNVHVTVCFSFYSNYAARDSEPLILNPGAL